VATYKPFKETIELKSSDVPPIVIEKLGDAVAWSKEPLTDADKARLPREVVDAAERLKAKIVLPFNSRAVFEELFLEKKIYHQVAFSIVNSPQTVWVAGPKLAVFSDVNPVLAMYAGMLEELRSEIAANRVKDASELLARLEVVPSIAEEVGKLRRKMRVKLLWPAILGSIIPALAVSAGGTLLIMKALAGSLNVKMVVYQAVAANLLFAIFIGFALFSVAGKFVYGLAKRVILSFFVTITFLGLLYGGAILMRFNPARDIDEQQMKAEYAAYFPFGRRTLATDVDIKFLGRLINKYKLAGIDLSQQRQDMKWLEDKIIQDKASLVATEKVREKIEDIDTGKTQKNTTRRLAASHRKRKHSKIQIK